MCPASYQEYRKEEAAKRAEIAALKQARAERIARGEDPGPEVHDPYEPVEIGCLGLLKFFVLLLLRLAMTGYLVTR